MYRNEKSFEKCGLEMEEMTHDNNWLKLVSSLFLSLY